MIEDFLLEFVSSKKSTMSCLTFTEIFQFSQPSQVSKVLKTIFVKHQKDISSKRHFVKKTFRQISKRHCWNNYKWTVSYFVEWHIVKSSKKKSRYRKYFTYKLSPYPMAYHFMEKPILKHFVTWPNLTQLNLTLPNLT